MKKFTKAKKLLPHLTSYRNVTNGSVLKQRLRQWQYSRSWARLICEAEKLWRLDSKSLKRLGALELNQLHNEIPFNVRRRVNFWLVKYAGSRRF